MKRFEGFLAAGLATAALASGCGGNKHQSPETVTALRETIRPVATMIASRALALSAQPESGVDRYKEYDKTDRNKKHYQTVIAFSTDPNQEETTSANITFKDTSPTPAEVQTVVIEQSNCSDGFHGVCELGKEVVLYSPSKAYEGETSWAASATEFIPSPPESIGNDEIVSHADTVDALIDDKDEKQTAEEIVDIVEKNFGTVILNAYKLK